MKHRHRRNQECSRTSKPPIQQSHALQSGVHHQRAFIVHHTDMTGLTGSWNMERGLFAAQTLRSQSHLLGRREGIFELNCWIIH